MKWFGGDYSEVLSRAQGIMQDDVVVCPKGPVDSVSGEMHALCLCAVEGETLGGEMGGKLIIGCTKVCCILPYRALGST